jgi:hypothetical protein
MTGHPRKRTIDSDQHPISGNRTRKSPTSPPEQQIHDGDSTIIIEYPYEQKACKPLFSFLIHSFFPAHTYFQLYFYIYIL